MAGPSPPLPPHPPSPPEARGQAGREHAISTGLATSCGQSLTSQLRQHSLPGPPPHFLPSLSPHPQPPPSQPHCPLWKKRTASNLPSWEGGPAGARSRRCQTLLCIGRHLINDRWDGFEPNPDPGSPTEQAGRCHIRSREEARARPPGPQEGGGWRSRRGLELSWFILLSWIKPNGHFFDWGQQKDFRGTIHGAVVTYRIELNKFYI